MSKNNLEIAHDTKTTATTNDDRKNSELNRQIHALALASGCKAKWCNGIFGYAWHCMCPGDDHACDEQCSDITLKSAQLALDRMKKAQKGRLQAIFDPVLSNKLEQAMTTGAWTPDNKTKQQEGQQTKSLE